MPWKNGGGTTSELYVRHEAGFEGFVLRISIATVSQDGPFSFFPGVERTLLILTGGCVLRTPSGITTLRPSDLPFVFQGEEEVSCERISGTFNDFNVMINRTWGSAKVSRGKQGYVIEGSEFCFVYRSEEEDLLLLSLGESYVAKGTEILIECRRDQHSM